MKLPILQLIFNRGAEALQQAGAFVSGVSHSDSEKRGMEDPSQLLGNPLRGMTPNQAASMLDEFVRGEFTRCQWTFWFVEQIDPDVQVIANRRTSSVEELGYEVRINKDLAEKMGKLDVAERQQAALQARYERLELKGALSHLATAPLRGFALVSIQGDKLEPIPQWWWLRRGMFGPWFLNLNLQRQSAFGMPDDQAENMSQYLVLESQRSLLFIALLKFLRANASQKWWDKFCEIASKNGTVIIAPPNLTADQVAVFRADALGIALGGSGTLPNGSDVKATGPQRQGPAPFETHMRFLREGVVLAGTGGLLGSLTGATGMGSGVSDAHADVFRVLRNQIANDISAEFRRKIDKPLLAAQFPGEPVLAYFELDTDEKTSASAYLDDAVKAKNAGFDMDAEELSEKTGYTLKAGVANFTPPAPPEGARGTVGDAAAIAPDAGATAGGQPAAAVADTAFNGAQVTAAAQVVKDVAAGALPRETGVMMLVQFFRMSQEAAEQMMGTTGNGFKPAVIANRAGRRLLVNAGGFEAGTSDAANVQKQLKALEDAALKEFGPAYKEMLQPFMDQVKAATTPEELQAALDAFKATPEARKALADIVARTVMPAAMRGQALDLGARTALALKPLPFQEAIEFWEKKTTDSGKLANATWEQAQTYGMKVAGLTEKSALEAIKADIGSVVAGNSTVADFVKTAADKYGIQSPLAETIVRTNVQTAFQYGHYQRLESVKDELPIWGLDVVNDGATSAICRRLLTADGRRMAWPANHPIWDTMYPPLHFNCRTTVVPFESVEEAEAQGFVVLDKPPRSGKDGGEIGPAKGFEMNVGRVKELGDVPDEVAK